MPLHTEALAPEMEYEVLKKALTGFLSPDKTVRDSSNETIISLPFQLTLPFLVEELNRTSNELSLRRLAVVLLRKTLLAYKSALSWDAANSVECVNEAQGTQEAKRVVAEGLIDALREEKEVKADLSRVICDAIEVLAGFYKATGEWKGPWEELQRLLSSEDDVHGIGMIMLERMVRVRGGAKIISEMMPVVPALRRCLCKEDPAIRSAALKAALSCIRESNQTTLHKALCNVSVDMFEACIKSGCSDDMEVLVELTESYPKLWGDDPEGFLNRLGEYLLDEKAELDCRRAALTAMVALLTHAPKWAAKNPRTVAQLYLVLFDVCCNPSRQQTDEAYATRREEESAEDEDGSLFISGLESVAKMVKKFENQMLYDLSLKMPLEVLEQQTRQPQPWNRLFGALMCVYNIADTRPTPLEAIGPKLTSVLVGLTQHDNVRVRVAALSVIAVFFEKLGSAYQEPGRVQCLMMALIRSIGTDPAPRCRCGALTALCLFLASLREDEDEEEDDEQDEDDREAPCSRFAIVEPYVEKLLQHAVIPAVEFESNQVKELGLAAASLLAQCCGHKFTPYYSLFMTAAKNILTKGGSEDLRYLCETAIELMGQLCVSVGRKVFSEDADWLMQSWMSILEHEVPTDGSGEGNGSMRFTAVVLASLSRIAGCLGNRFLPYLHPIVKHVLPAALQTADVCLREETAASGFGSPLKASKMTFNEVGGVTTVAFKDTSDMLQCISINTGAVEEKKACMELLSLLSVQFRKEFSTYAQTCCEVLHRDMTATLRAVRETAFENYANFMGSLVYHDSSCSSEPALYAKFVVTGLPIIMAAMAQRKLPEVAETILPCLRDVLETLDSPFPGTSGQSVGQHFTGALEAPIMVATTFESLGKLLLSTVTDEMSALCNEQQQPKQAKQDDDWENVSENSEGEEDDAGLVYDGVMHCVCSLLHVYGEDCAELVEKHMRMPFATLLSHEDANKLGKVAALCTFAEAINCCGHAMATRYGEAYLAVSIVYAKCEQDIENKELQDADVMRVQAAAFAIGL
eukprot:GHVS01100179.1.p1 GENE.GHVS01100179.1~~GHVS01100179.1.p1  ORF type:complete len:1033 (+),score=163.64 GHVS01100179.1:85-3183(+)